ncbi:site-specific integrase [Fibrobacter sp.]|uniref:site-specific integrase n=1 Tax=Fibrobacter sp. TaxID=35828 RepID=UPI00262BA304|nr:site-specific integrase [Fibrobacter sp.]MDD5942033.1 site-specific integrase [Fibrobacter sp.]
MSDIIATQTNKDNMPMTTQKAVEILNTAPTFEELDKNSQKSVIQIAMVDNLKKDLQFKAKIAKLNYDEIKTTFLANLNSAHTRDAYSRALARLEVCLKISGKNFAELSTLEADQFIRSSFLSKPMDNGVLNMGAEDRAPAAIRRDASAISAFYSFVERVTNHSIMNPLRGTRALPKKTAKKALVIPTESDVVAILNSKLMSRELRAAFAVMTLRGLRVGGLPNLVIDYETITFSTISKGKEYKGNFDDSIQIPGCKSILDYLKVFKGKRKPFAELSDTKLKMQIAYWMAKMNKSGLVSSVFSAHDFRHFYASHHYQVNKDIYRLKTLLNHGSIAVTETYLKTLNLI